MTRGRRSAIVVPIRLPAPLEAIRFRETANARVGVPAHVTILFPFVPPGAIDGAVLRRVAAVVGRAETFDTRFGQVNRWDPSEEAPRGLLWLPPERAAPFVELIEALWQAFPEYPPYEGVHDTVVPHVTIATDDFSRFDAIQPEASKLVPFRRRVSGATLIVEGLDGRWRTRRRLPFGR